MNSFRIHKINPQKLVTEIFKVMKDVKLSNDCSLKNELKIHSVRYDIETASVDGARALNSLSSDIKECEYLELFKSKIKKMNSWKLPLKTLSNLPPPNWIK